LPHGKRVGNEWRCGSVDGDVGKSVGVHLTGDKAGVWSDFATGESGDLIDLWCAVRCCSTATAMNEAADYLGVKVGSKPSFAKREKVFEKPKAEVPAFQEVSKVVAYLSDKRKISPETIKAFRVSESSSGEIVFPSFDPSGDLVLIKYRGKNKKIRAEAGCKPILFGWQALSETARSIVICEGEIDAMSFHEYGIPAMSVPFGGGGGSKQDWIEHEYENLERFDSIYLAMDMDEEGRKATAEIVSRLGRHRCRVVDLPEKDANECLVKGFSSTEIWNVLSVAKTQDPTELRNAVEYTDDIIREFNPSEQEIGFLPPWDKASSLRFREGEVTVISGINGHGKSEAVGHMVIHAIHQGEKVCVASMEFKPKRFLRNLVRQTSGVSQPTDDYIRAIAEDFLEPSLWVFDVTGTAVADRMLEVFVYARKRYGVKLFVIDNLSKMDVDMDKNEPQRQFMAKLTDFAKDNDVHVFLVTHQKKVEDEYTKTGKMDVKGSGAITDLADTVIIWRRNKKKEDRLREADLDEAEREDLERQPDAFMRCEKQRNGEDEPKIGVYWHSASHQFTPYRSAPPVEYVKFSKQTMRAA
jgi:twinkle protein